MVVIDINIWIHIGWLWLRGGASIYYQRVTGSIPPCLFVEMSLGKTLNPELLLMCGSAPCMAATAISE